MFKKISKKLLVFSLLVGGLLFARFVLAQNFGTDVVGNGLNGSLGQANVDPRTLAANIINVALGFLSLIAVCIILYAGFLWMSSNGEEDKVSKAKLILKNGVIGLVIVLSAWGIATFVIMKLSGATGGLGSGGDGSGCTDGTTSPCGCGGSMLCTNGTLGTCAGGSLANCPNPPTSCDSSSTPGCQKASQICASGYYCDNSCLCQTKAELGSSCDADLSNSTCDVDNNRCAEYLTCNPTTCLCDGPPVITGLSPVGGFCNANSNKSCTKDSDCGSGDTCDVKTVNGARNNFVTISGKNFGEIQTNSSGDYIIPGKVIFVGSPNSVEAASPSTVNPLCIGSWRNDQIIVAIPGGVQTGPIKVVNKDGLEDVTNNDFGPKLNDFVSNGIARPGLCNIDPVKGTLSSEVNYKGVNLYSGKAYFGNYQDNISGLSSNFSNPAGLSGTSTTPNIKSGESGSFVETVVAGAMQKSNYLKFVKAAEEGEGPYIMSFSPTSTAPSQYVTVKGVGFGGAKGESKVYFVSGANKIEASYAFPAICANSVWSDKQIIIKVPSAIANNNYTIEIQLKDNTLTTQNLNPNTVYVSGSVPLAPSLCKMDPEKGPIDTPVTFWGEYFGGKGENVLIKFNLNQNINGVIKKEKEADVVDASVPKTAITGPVQIVRKGLGGNTLDFSVAECTKDDECNNSICCPQNTYRKGRCVASINECFTDIPTSVFEWSFSTSFDATTTSPFSSCLGLSKYLGSCYQGAMCPNSPGACSSGSTSYDKVVGSCDLTCNNVPGCTSATCTYDASIDKCVKKSTKIVSDCDLPELVAPASGSDLTDDKNVPRVMFWQGKINQHWNLSKGIWESDIDEQSGAELDHLTYCKKFYPTTVRVEAYKVEASFTWHSGGSKAYVGSTKQSYKCILSVGLNNLQKTCNSKGNWQVTLASSCPVGWVRGANNVCVQTGSICNSCSANLSCEKVKLFNTCVSDKLCKDKGASCLDNLANPLQPDNCIIKVEPSCECCCRIGKDKEDCCAPLTCAGKCGSDVAASTNTYGSCSGCAKVGNTQAAHDAACNCSTSSGKFCDINSDHPQGICTDCAGIDTQAVCGDHSSACCYDANKTGATATDDFCRGVDGSSILSLNKSSADYGYCGYFGCDLNSPTTCAATPNRIGKPGFYSKKADCVTGCPKNHDDPCVIYKTKDSCSAEDNCCYDAKTSKCKTGNQISGVLNNGYCAYFDCKTPPADPYTCNSIATTTGKFSILSSCSTTCGNPPGGAGLGCASSADYNSCDLNLCSANGSSCLQDKGAEGAFPNCGTCCCQPAVGSTPDSCATPSTPLLRCKADQGACSGASRGLCCGCQNDGDCGSAVKTGCGSDTCCQARPGVFSSSPTASATNVCRNAAIKVTFKQKMDADSFVNNFVLFEEKTYGNGVCPAGTFIADADAIKSIAQAQNKNFLVRFWENISNKFISLFQNNKALAVAPSATKLYCSIPGTVTAEEASSRTEASPRTSLIFTPVKALAPSTRYFAVVKGDELLNSQAGVLSAVQIGMNEGGFRDAYGANPTNPIKFNNQTYTNAYSFQFTTLSDQGVSAGICAVDHVTLTPSTYLFKTTVNDLNEKDETDTVADRDKVFVAGAYSLNNQLLHSTPGYAWDWNWVVTDTGVAEILTNNVSSSLGASAKIIAAKAGVTDAQTQVSAAVDMSKHGSNVFKAGDKENAQSNIYVFVCANPWPAPQADGSWSPWNDAGNNCSTGTGTCEGYNYKFYYCRDAGAAGTSDDLPAINNSPISRSGNLLCNSNNTPCSSLNSSCDSGKGVCLWNVLKESYFFRESVLDSAEIVNLTDTRIGGEAQIEWLSASANVSSFKVYYLKSGKGAMLSKEFAAAGANCYQVPKSFNCSAKINGLVDGQEYIFKVSVISNNKTESAFSNERAVITSDKTATAAPASFALDSNTNLKFTWQTNTDTKVIYRLYHGTASGKYAESYDSVAGASSMSLDRTLFSNGSHYFALTAIDAAKNESLKSTELVITIVPTMPANFSLNSDTNLKFTWEAKADTKIVYRLYHGIMPRQYTGSYDSAAGASSMSLDKTLFSPGKHYFVLSAIDTAKNESQKSAELVFTKLLQ